MHGDRRHYSFFPSKAEADLVDELVINVRVNFCYEKHQGLGNTDAGVAGEIARKIACLT